MNYFEISHGRGGPRKERNRLIKKYSLLIKSGICTFAFACMLAFSVNAHAEGTATVSVQSANIRSSASSSSSVVAGVLKNDKLDIISSETDGSGYTWYKVYVDANTTGYIRADLVTAEGAPSASAPQETPSENTTTSTSVEAVPPTETEEAVTEVEPVPATVTGEVRVRKGPSTSTDVVTTANQGTSVTVIGYANSPKDNTLWYKLTYTSNTSNVEGYIRNDFVKLSGELVDKVEAPVIDEEPVIEEPPVVEEPVVVYKDFEAVFDESEKSWYINNYIEGTRVKLDELYEAKDKLVKAEASHKAELKKKNLVIVALAIVIFALVAAGVYAYIRFRQWYFGYDDETEETVNTKRTSREESTKTYSRETKSSEPVRTSNVKAQTVGGPSTTVKASETGAASTVNPQSSVVLKGIPEGGVRLPDGRIQMPDGSIRRAVVGVKLPDGSIKLPDGRIRKPDGTIVMPEQSMSPAKEVTPVRTGASSQDVREVPVRHEAQLTTDDDDMEFGFLNLDSNLSDD